MVLWLFLFEAALTAAVGVVVGSVVGSAIVNQIAANGKSPDLVAKVATFVKTLADAVKGS